MYYTYVIQNNLGKLYTGQTNNLVNRLKRHNDLLKAKKSSFTHKNKNNGIWKLVYSENYKTRNEAVKREKELKSHKGRNWIKLQLGSGSSMVEQ